MLRARQRLDKYRIDKLLAQGGFSDVYQAYDTIEGVRVALKIPHAKLTGEKDLGDFRREARIMAKLDHPNILPIKNAAFIGGHFVIVYPLGSGSLGDRISRRISFDKAMGFTEQMLEALSCAHSLRIVHCDVKPENFILFPRDRLRLGDFGLAKIARGSLSASGSGTVGYIAPEQAMGKPSRSSDVFAMGLILYRLLTGSLPQWPFDWPPVGYARLKKKCHPDLIRVIQKAIQTDERQRFSEASQMLHAFRKARKRREKVRPRKKTPSVPRWKDLLMADFKRIHASRLSARHPCPKCGGLLSEMMVYCPWCGRGNRFSRQKTTFAARCKRCGHGMKKDWTFCCMCYGGAQGPRNQRIYPDRRYTEHCRACGGGLIPFMRYCPWCRAKIRRPWKIPGEKGKCSGCHWGILPDFWTWCPWCRKRLRK